MERPSERNQEPTAAVFSGPPFPGTRFILHLIGAIASAAAIVVGLVVCIMGDRDTWGAPCLALGILVAMESLWTPIFEWNRRRRMLCLYADQVAFQSKSSRRDTWRIAYSDIAAVNVLVLDSITRGGITVDNLGVPRGVVVTTSNGQQYQASMIERPREAAEELLRRCGLAS